MKIIHYKELDSTQKEARRIAEEYRDEWTAVVADMQTDGEGQRGRQWISLSGNLHITYIAPLVPRPLMGLITAETICTSLLDNIWIKWPNDLFIRYKKCGGILCEGINKTQTLIGIGINLHSAPEGFETLNLSVEPIEYASALGVALQKRLNEELTLNLNRIRLLYQDQWVLYEKPDRTIETVKILNLRTDGALQISDSKQNIHIIRSGRLLGLAPQTDEILKL